MKNIYRDHSILIKQGYKYYIICLIPWTLLSIFCSISGLRYLIQKNQINSWKQAFGLPNSSQIRVKI